MRNLFSDVKSNYVLLKELSGIYDPLSGLCETMTSVSGIYDPLSGLFVTLTSLSLSLQLELSNDFRYGDKFILFYGISVDPYFLTLFYYYLNLDLLDEF